MAYQNLRKHALYQIIHRGERVAFDGVRFQTAGGLAFSADLVLHMWRINLINVVRKPGDDGVIDIIAAPFGGAARAPAKNRILADED